MKAVLVIDIPNELDVNNLLIDYCVHTKGEYKPIRKGGNHPLIPLLKHFTMDEILMAKDVKTAIEMRAYNDCLDEIMGETE